MSENTDTDRKKIRPKIMVRLSAAAKAEWTKRAKAAGVSIAKYVQGAVDQRMAREDAGND